MKKCFVIQPFDGGVFDKRYDDIFSPSIKATGLEPYRVDRDPSVSIPIIEIEKNIRDSEICLADITTDNPNVWFELGFAFASGKEVVMVCSAERRTRFPFDVQHRNIIRYTNESQSDFERLGNAISDRISALLKKQKEIGDISTSLPIANSEGLSTHEIVALVCVMQNQFAPEQTVSTYQIKQDMLNAGFTEIATSLGLASLIKKNMVTVATAYDNNGEQYAAYAMKQKGIDWLIDNQDKLILRRSEPEVRKVSQAPF